MAMTRDTPIGGESDPEGGDRSNGIDEARSPSAGRRRARAERRGEDRHPEKGSNRSERARNSEVNAIRPSKRAERTQEGQGTPSSAEPAAEAKAVPPDPPANAPHKSLEGKTDPWTVPQSVRDRFIRDGRRFYFPDGEPAFKDLGRRLTTKSENTAVVGSLIEIAQSRGWDEITVSGTERFRQEAWRQARLAGLTVRGYKPSAIERAQLVRAMARGSDATRSETSQPSPSGAAPSGQSQDSVAEGGSRSGTAPRESPRERIVGKLLDHGRDAYRHDPNEEPSYFVTISTPTGKREIWGRDLERAMTKSLTQPLIGEEVTLQRTAREPVTVSRQKKDADGRVIGEHEVATYRNRWVIERSEFFKSRAAAAHVLRDPSIEPKRAVGSHPELAGTYLNLRAAEIAARTIRDPVDQKRFVALVRGALADQVERGEPLQPVRLREREIRSKDWDRQPGQARG
jgi:Large polyvalent protein-associated domain 7